MGNEASKGGSHVSVEVKENPSEGNHNEEVREIIEQIIASDDHKSDEGNQNEKDNEPQHHSEKENIEGQENGNMRLQKGDGQQHKKTEAIPEKKKPKKRSFFGKDKVKVKEKKSTAKEIEKEAEIEPVIEQEPKEETVQQEVVSTGNEEVAVEKDNDPLPPELPEKIGHESLDKEAKKKKEKEDKKKLKEEKKRIKEDKKRSKSKKNKRDSAEIVIQEGKDHLVSATVGEDQLEVCQETEDSLEKSKSENIEQLNDKAKDDENFQKTCETLDIESEKREVTLNISTDKTEGENNRSSFSIIDRSDASDIKPNANSEQVADASAKIAGIADIKQSDNNQTHENGDQIDNVTESITVEQIKQNVQEQSEENALDSVAINSENIRNSNNTDSYTNLLMIEEDKLTLEDAFQGNHEQTPENINLKTLESEETSDGDLPTQVSSVEPAQTSEVESEIADVENNNIVTDKCEEVEIQNENSFKTATAMQVTKDNDDVKEISVETESDDVVNVEQEPHSETTEIAQEVQVISESENDMCKDETKANEISEQFSGTETITESAEENNVNIEKECEVHELANIPETTENETVENETVSLRSENSTEHSPTVEKKNKKSKKDDKNKEKSEKSKVKESKKKEEKSKVASKLSSELPHDNVSIASSGHSDKMDSLKLNNGTNKPQMYDSNIELNPDNESVATSECLSNSSELDGPPTETLTNGDSPCVYDKIVVKETMSSDSIEKKKGKRFSWKPFTKSSNKSEEDKDKKKKIGMSGVGKQTIDPEQNGAEAVNKRRSIFDEDIHIELDDNHDIVSLSSLESEERSECHSFVDADQVTYTEQDCIAEEEQNISRSENKNIYKEDKSAIRISIKVEGQYTDPYSDRNDCSCGSVHTVKTRNKGTQTDLKYNSKPGSHMPPSVSDSPAICSRTGQEKQQEGISHHAAHHHYGFTHKYTLPLVVKAGNGRRQNYGIKKGKNLLFRKKESVNSGDIPTNTCSLTKPISFQYKSSLPEDENQPSVLFSRYKINSSQGDTELNETVDAESENTVTRDSEEVKKEKKPKDSVMFI